MSHSSSSSHQKDQSSEPQTRNPTTNKKVVFYTPVNKRVEREGMQGSRQTYAHSYLTPKNRGQKDNCKIHRMVGHATGERNKSRQKGRQKLHSSCDKIRVLNKSIRNLSAEKQDCMSSSRYSQAARLKGELEIVSRRRCKTIICSLEKDHKREKKDVRKAYRQQMKRFENIWEQYFVGLYFEEQETLRKFRLSQKRDIRIIQNNLIKKCRSFRVNKADLVQAEKKERLLRKEDRVKELIELKHEKQEIKKRVIERQQNQILKWALQEENFLKCYHTKKYCALIARMQESHSDRYELYLSEKSRLDQKYKNVLKKLNHEQAIEKQQILEKLSVKPVESSRFCSTGPRKKCYI